MSYTYIVDEIEYDLTTPIIWDEPLVIRRLKAINLRSTVNNLCFFCGFLEDFKQTDKKLITKYINLLKDVKNCTIFDTHKLSQSERDVLVTCWLFGVDVSEFRYLDFSQLFELHFTDAGESLQSIVDSKGGLIVDFGDTLYHSQYNDVPVGVLLDKLSGTSKKCLFICKNSCNLDNQTRSKIVNDSRWCVISNNLGDQVSTSVKKF